jgi:hypothetical protein
LFFFQVAGVAQSAIPEFFGLHHTAETPVMTRVRKNVPPFTVRLCKEFVNAKTRVSTGFLRFFLAFLWKTRFLRCFGHPRARGEAFCAGLREERADGVECSPAAGGAQCVLFKKGR